MKTHRLTPIKPQGRLYLFMGVFSGATNPEEDGYLIRDMKARRFLKIAPFTYREEAKYRAGQTLSISQNDDLHWYSIECKEGVTWDQIRATKGWTHAQIVERFEYVEPVASGIQPLGCRIGA